MRLVRRHPVRQQRRYTVDNNIKCPSCGGELKAAENGFFVCQACGKAFRRAEKKTQATAQDPVASEPWQSEQQPAQQSAEQASAAPQTAEQPDAPVYGTYGAPQPTYQGAGATVPQAAPAEVYTPARKGYVKGRWWVSRVSMGILTLLLGLIAVGLSFGVGGDEFVSVILGMIGLGACVFAAVVLVLALVSRNTEVSVWALIGMMIASCVMSCVSIISMAATSMSGSILVSVLVVVIIAFMLIFGMLTTCDIFQPATLGKLVMSKKSFMTSRDEELNARENRRSWLSLGTSVVLAVLVIVVALVLAFARETGAMDPLKKADEVYLGMGRYEVTDIIGEYAERDGESDIDSSVYVWYDAEYASLVEEEKSLFDKLMDCKDADEALSIMQRIVDIEEEKAGKAYTMFTVVFEDGKAVSMSLVNRFPEAGDLTFEKKVEKNDCEYTASTNRKDDEGDGFYLEVKLAWSDGSWSKYYSEAIIADMEYDEVSGRYTVTCPITFDSENMVNYTLTATEAEWANTYGFTDIAEYYATYFAEA